MPLVLHRPDVSLGFLLLFKHRNKPKSQGARMITTLVASLCICISIFIGFPRITFCEDRPQ